MLNISGSGNNNDDDANANSSGNTNVNLGVLGTPHQVHQVHNPNGSTSFVYEYYKVPDKDGLQWRYVQFRIQPANKRLSDEKKGDIQMNILRIIRSSLFNNAITIQINQYMHILRTLHIQELILNMYIRYTNIQVTV